MARLLLGMMLAPMLLASQPAWAQISPEQEVAAEPALDPAPDPADELQSLIPDSAVADPQGWARGAPDPQVDPATLAEVAEVTVDADAPLDPAQQINLAWPDKVELPPFDPVPPETQLAEEEARAIADQLREDAAAVDLAAPDVDPATLLPIPQLAPAADAAVAARSFAITNVRFLGTNPPDAAMLDRFAMRFKALSALETNASSDDNIAQIARRAQADRALIEQMMRIDGYYDAEVRQQIDRADGDEEAGLSTADVQTRPRNLRIRFDVTTGPQYRVAARQLGALDAALPGYEALRAAFGNMRGQPISSDAILQGRFRLEDALGEGGYALATLGEPALTIDHTAMTGTIVMPVTPGERYVFGSITSNDERLLSAKHLYEIARFSPGDPFRASRVEDLRRAVLATGLVSSVALVPRAENTRENAAAASASAPAIALDISVTPAPLRTIAGQAGYGTGEGFRVEASWEHRNLFPPEGALRLRGVLGTQEQLVNLTFRRSNFKRRDQLLTGDLLISNVDRRAYAASTVQVSASVERLTNLIFQKAWVWSAGVELLATDERDGEVGGVNTARRTYFIASLPLRLAYDGSDDLLDPTSGIRASFRISPEFSLEGGSYGYARMQLDLSGYQRVSDRVVIAARGRLGSIPGVATSAIAPSRRFYAGGGGSVRGFGYQGIGPRDTLNEPSGGRALSEFSLEARVRLPLFENSFSIVPFVDAGAVDDGTTPRLSDLRFGAGVGIRYHTAFGPIRVDLGTPLGRRKGESMIGVYVSLGQAF